MKTSDVIVAAQSRCTDYGVTFPNANSLLYRRMGVRQQQLFAVAAQLNPDYFGIYATVVLAAGAADMSLMLGDGVLEAELVTRILVEDKGTSTYANGQQVNIVDLADPEVADAPRVSIRGGIIRQIGTDLVNVTSLRVEYSYRPGLIGQDDDGQTVLLLPTSFGELLVIDLARDLTAKAMDIDAAKKGVISEALKAEEAGLLASFGEHVMKFVNPQRRFGDPTARRPKTK